MDIHTLFSFFAFVSKFVKASTKDEDDITKHIILPAISFDALMRNEDKQFCVYKNTKTGNIEENFGDISIVRLTTKGPGMAFIEAKKYFNESKHYDSFKYLQYIKIINNAEKAVYMLYKNGVIKLLSAKKMHESIYNNISVDYKTQGDKKIPFVEEFTTGCKESQFLKNFLLDCNDEDMINCNVFLKSIYNNEDSFLHFDKAVINKAGGTKFICGEKDAIDELSKNCDDFQKNFTNITGIIKDLIVNFSTQLQAFAEQLNNANQEQKQKAKNTTINTPNCR